MPSRIDVLMIDDSITDLRLLLELMTLRDLRFSVARDGEQGYRQAVVLDPGLILLDIHMMGTDGFTVCRRLKANASTAEIPVIFLTAATDLATRLEGFRVGGVDYITKPFNESEVLARVGVHLGLAARRMSEHARRSGTGEGVRPLTTPDEVLVVAAQRILRESISSPPSLEELASRVGSNRRRLGEAFQAFCGQTVFAWLREERFRRAHQMLCETTVPVSSISDALGYSTPANFSKAFRERHGLTPSEIREGAIPPLKASKESAALKQRGLRLIP
jgi:DNA-binding response OmpR family regulator